MATSVTVKPEITRMKVAGFEAVATGAASFVRIAGGGLVATIQKKNTHEIRVNLPAPHSSHTN
ncbi:hypothetical protein BGE01nite_01990 [Brevifollis gellanilyticus]|uniref:Uncharacterized protein n=1 Tax=Brevifollis gellanilyticus TaxID=748831 RepID=A0A512M2H5_9BACT|nr:hypothetical protein BGE01nite_01990 [Brevifollis gellanilyticus]